MGEGPWATGSKPGARHIERSALSSVANALRVLERLVELGEGGVSELARDLHFTPGTSHRLLSTLVVAGFVEQSPETRRYRPSLKLISLADKMRVDLSLSEVVHPYMEELMRQAHETVNLGVLRDGEVLYTHKVFSEEIFRVEVRVGSRVPAYCIALGKALLAFGDERARSVYLDYLDGLKDMPSSVRDIPAPPSRAAFASELERVRELGYAEDHGAFLPDVYCVAAPVYDRRGRATAAISVSAPRSRFERQRGQLISLVKATAEQLTVALQEAGALD